MAKKKGATGRARASRKKAAKEKAKPQAETQTERMAAAAEANAAENPEADNRAILDGAELQRLVTEAVAQGVTQALAAQGEQRSADWERTDPIEATPADSGRKVEAAATVLKRIDESVRDLYSKVDDIQQSNNRDTITAQATAEANTRANARVAAMVRERLQAEKIQIRRREIWAWERIARGVPGSLPRPSIIGRALCELQNSETGESLTPAAVFKCIADEAPHHLSTTILRLTQRYKGSNNKVDTNISGKLGKQFRKKLQGLKDGGYVTTVGSRPRLTAKGLETFDGWPDWSSRDDDVKCEGLARDDATEAPPAVSAEGGSASAASE